MLIIRLTTGNFDRAEYDEDLFSLGVYDEESMHHWFVVMKSVLEDFLALYDVFETQLEKDYPQATVEVTDHTHKTS